MDTNLVSQAKDTKSLGMRLPIVFEILIFFTSDCKYLCNVIFNLLPAASVHQESRFLKLFLTGKSQLRVIFEDAVRKPCSIRTLSTVENFLERTRRVTEEYLWFYSWIESVH